MKKVIEKPEQIRFFDADPQVLLPPAKSGCRPQVGLALS
jgi:hypothetical protein